MENQSYNRANVEAAMAAFKSAPLTPAEGLVAAAQLLQENLRGFRASAQDFRTEVGDELSRRFATEELNDIIYELQDSITPLLKTYNSLLRDPDASSALPE